MSSGPTPPRGTTILALPTLIDLVIPALGSALAHGRGRPLATFSTIRFVGNQPGSNALFQCSGQRLRRLGRALRRRRPGTVPPTMCHGEYALDPRRGAGGELPDRDRKTTQYAPIRRRRRIPRRARADQELRGAGAVHVHFNIRPHRVPAVGPQRRTFGAAGHVVVVSPTEPASPP